MKFLWVIYGVCALIGLYQVGVLMNQYIHIPYSTSMNWEATADKAFEWITVCISGWEESKWKARNLDKNFALGFNQNLGTLLSHWSWTKNSTADKLLNATQTYLKNETTYLEYVRNFYRVDDQKSKDRYTLEPGYLTGTKACFRMHLKPKYFNNSRLFIDEAQWVLGILKLPKFLQKYPIHFSLHMGDTDITLFNVGKEFTTVNVDPVDYTTIEIETTMCPKKYIALQNRRHPCVPAQSVTERLPYEHYRRKCQMECVYEDQVRMRDCFPLPVWLRMSEDERKGKEDQVCHSLIWRKRTDTSEKIYHAQCEEEKRCKDLFPCVSWRFNYKTTVSYKLKDDGLPYSKPSRKAFIYIRVRNPSIIEVIEQFSSVSFESVVGNVGGVLGVWIGISVFGLVEVVMLLGEKLKLCGRKNKTGGQLAEKAENENGAQ